MGIRAEIADLCLAEFLLKHGPLSLGFVFGGVDPVHLKQSVVLLENFPGIVKVVEIVDLIHGHLGGGQGQGDDAPGAGAGIKIHIIPQAFAVIFLQLGLNLCQKLGGGGTANAASVQR